jgi:hypothetical protein
MPPTTADDGVPISPERAQKIIKDFQNDGNFFKGIRGGFYGRNVLMNILNQPNCKGIRYYHALVPNKETQALEHTIVLVGMDTNGAEMAGTFTDEGPLCPPFCG